MCLILLSINSHQLYKIILAANRDEFLDRPTASAHFWENPPDILAGRDLRDNGTWLGIARAGQLAALTNFRNPSGRKQNAVSRGRMVSDLLENEFNPEECSQRLLRDAHRYNEFNLLFGNHRQLYFLSNREREPRPLSRGTYGLSNHSLDTPWPKVIRGKQTFQELVSGHQDIHPAAIFEILADKTQPDDKSLPDTGVGIEWERILAPIFVSSDSYGTRSSVVLLIDHEGKVSFTERTFFECDPDRFEEKSFEFTIGPRNQLSRSQDFP